MWKFFAFVMVVLLILMFIQMSTLSDEEVAKIRAQVEAQKEQQISEASQKKHENQSEKIKQRDLDAGDLQASSEFLSMPAVLAYEEYLNAIPDMTFFSEADKYINPDYSKQYKEKISAFSRDEIKVLKDMHDLSAMEYMSVENTDKSSKIRFIASSKLLRYFNKNILNEMESIEGLVECTVVMENISGNWFINSESWDAIPEISALSESDIEKRTARLAEYRKKRNNR